MLSELSIENVAIIPRLHLRFAPGLTVLTGETGAGKSIIIDALQAALGARVPPDVVRAGARLAAIEAVFDPPQLTALTAILEESGIETDDCLILRREINAGGRGTARVNGRAVPLAVLQAVGSLLVDIHGQSDHLAILRRDRQLDALDRFGDLLDLRGAVGDAVRAYNEARRRHAELVAGRREAEQRLDLLRFQVNEIESAALAPGEDELLAADRTRLANAERLAQLAGEAYAQLQGEQISALDRIGDALSSTRELRTIDPGLESVDERLQAAQYEIDDIAQELRRYRDGVEFDPARLNAIEERRDLIARLRRKYGATIEEILAFGEQARASLADVENLDERIAEAEFRLADAAARAGELAGDLTAARRTAAERLTAAMRDALQGLGLRSTTFTVELSRREDANGLQIPGHEKRFASGPTGIDAAAFYVSFNPGEPPRPLEKVASGGETSRFLLALKSVLAGADDTPTLIFDEVDVGVGARSGAVVGERLRQLAQSHQVISISHLPQIAALADQHLTVAKTVDDGRTSVAVVSLEGADRVAEIAEMMSGTSSEAARRNAEELLAAAQSGAGAQSHP
jgi:DNA repair protein RecN (Recombination protein N)